MKLQQLRYLVAIVRHKLNISEAAQKLCTSQSGISKQIKLLEEELNLTIIVRKGRKLIELTTIGQEIYGLAEKILEKTDQIAGVAADYNNQQGSLIIAATHTQARYVLPAAVKRFVNAYPGIDLHLHQGTPIQIANFAAQGDVDVAIATEALESHKELITLPCYRWSRCVVVKEGHPLTQVSKLTLKDIVQYPIVTYVLGFTGRYKLDEAFAVAQLAPNIVLTAVDADVIKTYVRLGLGVGIIAKMAFKAEQDKGLVALDATHLFGMSTSFIAFKRDKYIRNYVYRFIELLAPHLSERRVSDALCCNDKASRKVLFDSFKIPVY